MPNNGSRSLEAGQGRDVVQSRIFGEVNRVRQVEEMLVDVSEGHLDETKCARKVTGAELVVVSRHTGEDEGSQWRMAQVIVVWQTRSEEPLNSKHNVRKSRKCFSKTGPSRQNRMVFNSG